MDEYVIRVRNDGEFQGDSRDSPSPANSKNPRHRFRSKNVSSLLRDFQTLGRITPRNKRHLGKLTLMSFREVGRFKQFSINSRATVSTIDSLEQILSTSRTMEIYNRLGGPRRPPPRFGPSAYLSCIDFDSKGIYLAAVNSTRVLTIHEFETLYVKAELSAAHAATEVLISFADNALQAVRWNPANEDEVVCVGLESHSVAFYDVASRPFLPSQILRVKPLPDIVGLHDLRLCKDGSSRVLACGRDGGVHIWDRRASTQSNAALYVKRNLGSLNSLYLSSDDQAKNPLLQITPQLVYAGSDGGYIHSWDLRGGKRSSTFGSCREVYHEPLGAVKVSAALGNLSSLSAQTKIESSAVHAVAVYPSCGHRIAFHLYNGWSGLLDMATSEVTHFYGPPPFLYDEERYAIELGTFSDMTQAPWASSRFLLRKPAWINSLSVFAVPSASARDRSIHMLDFSPGPESRHHVDHECSSDCEREEQSQVNVPTSEEVVSVAAHPLTDELVAGTSEGNLLLVAKSQRASVEDDSDVSDDEDKR